MKSKCVAIWDNAVRSYKSPVYVPHLGGVTRELSDMVNGNKDHEFSKHPEDFELHLLGEFDDQTGDIVEHSGERLVVRLKDLVRG